LPGTGSYARGEQPRSVPDPVAGPYAKMTAQQAAYNSRQEAELERRRLGAAKVPSTVVSARNGVAAAFSDGTYRPAADDVIELRRRQMEFEKTRRAISRENAWMAVPALAPAAAVLGLEAAGMIASRLAPAAIQRAPLQLVQRAPHLRVGDNWATRAGRRARAELRERVAQKPGWDPEPTVSLAGSRIVRPDVRTPSRVRVAGRKPEPFQMELKPNTPSGQRAAARAIKKYEGTGIKTRPIFYDPKPFL
jgi:hypothetical protein